jgi:hypothetical protein
VKYKNRGNADACLPLGAVFRATGTKPGKMRDNEVNQPAKSPEIAGNAAIRRWPGLPVTGFINRKTVGNYLNRGKNTIRNSVPVVRAGPLSGSVPGRTDQPDYNFREGFNVETKVVLGDDCR